MGESETKAHYVQFDIDVNSWMQLPPGVRLSRPPRCPICDACGVHASGRVVLWGHGLRKRQLLGPLDAGGEPTVCELLLRRYRCQACRGVITVGPRGLLPRRQYSAMVIALALWLWAVHHLNDPAVRERTSPFADEGLSRPERWTTLRRWGRAVRDGRLWPGLSIDPSWSLRRCAERAAHFVWSRGSPDAHTDEGRVFHGAALAR